MVVGSINDVLIVKTSSFGDIIQSFDALEYLKQKAPKAKVSWLVEEEAKDLILAHPLVDHAIILNTKKWRKNPFSLRTYQEIGSLRSFLKGSTFDVAFDLQGNLKSGLFLSLVKARAKVGFGKNTVHEWPNLIFTNQKYDYPSGKNIREDYLFLIQSFFQDFTLTLKHTVSFKLSLEERETLEGLFQKIEKPSLKLEKEGSPLIKKILIAPNSRWPNKELDMKTLVEFLQLTQTKVPSLFLFTWNTSKEYRIALDLFSYFQPNAMLLPALKLTQLHSLMERCDLIIAMDSLPLHLAGLTSVPTFSFFGPSLEKKFCPTNPSHASFQASCPYHRQFEKRCPRLRSCETGACLKSLKAQDFFNQFYLWWADYSKKR